MKSNIYLCLTFLFATLISCSSQNDDINDGPNDVPVLKKSEYNASSKGDTINIEATTYFFYIVEIKSIQNQDTTTLTIDDYSKNETQNLTGDWYKIETSLNAENKPGSIKLIVSPNDTSKERTLLIDVQRVNNFETAVIKQVAGE